MKRIEDAVRPEFDAERIDYASRQGQAEESIGDSIYKLLIKNVSKNQPLTAEEAQVVEQLPV